MPLARLERTISVYWSDTRSITTLGSKDPVPSSYPSYPASFHYFGISLAHFLPKIDHNIISSFHIVFSLCTRVGWCDVCTDFTNVIEVDVEVDVNEMSLLNI